jgi:hypothetical protein
MERNAIFEQDKLSTNLNTIDGVLGLLHSIILRAQEGLEVEEHDLINGSNQIDTARRILRELREKLNVSHIPD